MRHALGRWAFDFWHCFWGSIRDRQDIRFARWFFRHAWGCFFLMLVPLYGAIYLELAFASAQQQLRWKRYHRRRRRVVNNLGITFPCQNGANPP
jgi:hypothetical protein